jgi:hypothetical protein
MTVAAQLPCAVHRFTEFADELLHALCAETRIAPFGPLLPALFAGPFQVPAPYPVMAFNKIAPQASSFTTGGRKRVPF